ncbi:hypothetical protein [Franconibacter daqui]|uniref:Integron cassette protein VCH-CASS1 chain domain-containing protein n=1 Tax=Franconibacter daqui TaxID=2047724 RepID=A0ABV1PT53_9ENTR
MAIKANDIDILHRYAVGVMERSDHHAENVGAVALTLLGGVIWRAKPGSINIRQYDGNLANVVWWTSEFTGHKYAVSYNHETFEIEIREETVNGNVKHTLSNSTPPDEVRQILSIL